MNYTQKYTRNVLVQFPMWIKEMGQKGYGRVSDRGENRIHGFWINVCEISLWIPYELTHVSRLIKLLYFITVLYKLLLFDSKKVALIFKNHVFFLFLALSFVRISKKWALPKDQAQNVHEIDRCRLLSDFVKLQFSSSWLKKSMGIKSKNG